MKKNITINLCGRLYQIDEDAYELLSHYIDTLRHFFSKQEGGEEIANDIEERVAELFDELNSQGVVAITIEDVQDIISRIGQVEDITGENGEAAAGTSGNGSGTSSTGATKNPSTGKKFYRDSQNKMLAGVLAGCAQYFGGSVSAWRWCYMLLMLTWACFHGLFFGFFFFLLSLPLLALPVVPYVLAVIFFPATQTPEDVLRMKGKEVNQQNLTVLVQENSFTKEKKSGASFWDICLGVICIGLSTALTLGLIVAMCFFGAYLVASEQMASSWWDVSRAEEQNAIFIPAIISGILLLASIAILLYCSVHAAVSSFGKTPTMTSRQRLIWFLLWIVTVVCFIVNTVYAASLLNEKRRERDNVELGHASFRRHYGFVFNDDDWRFFRKNGWRLVKAENTHRYTYNGEYMTGDLTRYLDASSFGASAPVVYQAEKAEDVQPGIYRLSAAVRADHNRCFIYLDGLNKVSKADTSDGGERHDSMKEIPVFGNEGGNIWELLAKEKGIYSNADADYLNDPVLKEIVGLISARNKQRIVKANGHRGFGWSYVYIDSIVVEQPTKLTYGVEMDDKQSIGTVGTGWFSATDFHLERLGDIEKAAQ